MWESKFIKQVDPVFNCPKQPEQMDLFGIQQHMEFIYSDKNLFGQVDLI